MCRADALYLNLKKHPVLERTIPSKLFDYLLAGKPIVAGLGGEGRRILEQTKANVCFEPGEISSVKKACRNLIDEYQRLRENSHKNRALVLERFTREEAAKTLMLVLRSTANGSHAVRSKNHADARVE